MVRVILPGPMDQRWLTYRILALSLALAWAALGAWLAVGHATVEGAGPLVAAWPLLPAAIAAAAGFAPRRNRAPAGRHLVLGLGAGLLAVSFAITLAEPSGIPDRALLAASPMVALGGGVAVAGTALFTLAGWRQAGSRWGATLALSLAAGIAAGAGLLLPATGIAAAACDAPPRAGAGRSVVVAEGWVDAERVAYARIDGAPDGGGSADAPTATLAALLAEITDPAVEDRGIDILDGTPLRHCRRLVSGSQALRGFDDLHLVTGSRPEPGVAAALGVWRGELDWWIGAGGELVAARVSVGGLAGDLWPGQGLRGLLRAELRVPRSSAGHAGEPLP